MALNRTLSVAPMMNYSDRHFRYLIRLLSSHALLYTEMIPTDALLHGHRKPLLQHHPAEYPLAIQLGGNHPTSLATCAAIAEDAGYNEVNLNIGCPSNRVKNGHFGACLMAEPELVAECVSAMQQRINIPVTIKTRIGIDDQDSYEELLRFIDIVHSSACHTFIIHARKAWLNGLSPKQNRQIPPLRHETVYQLKKDRPQLEIIINGGITTEAIALQQYTHVDGVMIGRAAYQNPFLLAQLEHTLFSDNKSNDNQPTLPNRLDILEKFTHYMQQNLQQGANLSHMTRHTLGLFFNQPAARTYRRHISENAHKKDAGIHIIPDAIAQMAQPPHLHT